MWIDMWPWGHIAVGYLLCSLWYRWRDGNVPTAGVAISLAVGTQFPDLIDKPLAWTFGVLPSGRAGAHSLLIAIPLLVFLWWRVDSSAKRRAWGGFALGYLAHLAADGVYSLVDAEFAELSYLFWPVLALPGYDESTGIVAHFLTANITLPLLSELVLFVAATLLWTADGTPGVRLVGRWCKHGTDGVITALSRR